MSICNGTGGAKHPNIRDNDSKREIMTSMFILHITYLFPLPYFPFPPISLSFPVSSPSSFLPPSYQPLFSLLVFRSGQYITNLLSSPRDLLQRCTYVCMYVCMYTVNARTCFKVYVYTVQYLGRERVGEGVRNGLYWYAYY